MEQDVECEWKVRSCSSEADVHTASNVLKSELYRVWQTDRPSDEAWLVLEAHSPSALSELEIVNAGSALVEVFGLPEEDDNEYLMLLSAQQLMSIKDVVNKANRSRSFTYSCSDKLSRLAMQHRWKQIKVLCHQPFGSEEQKSCIGLSRITFKPCKTLAEVAADAAEARIQQNLKAGLTKMFPKASSDECKVVSEVTEPSRPLQTQKVEKDFDANVASCGAESPSPLRGKRKLPTWQSSIKDRKNGARGGTSHEPILSEEDEEIAKVSQRKKAMPKVERSARNELGTQSETRSNPKKQEQDVATSSQKKTFSTEQEKEVSGRPSPKGPETSRPGPNKYDKGSPSTSRKRSEPSGIESSSTPGTHQAFESKQASAPLQVLDEPESSSKRKELPSSKRIGKKEETQSKSPASGGNKRPVQSSLGMQEPNQANAITVSFSKFLDGVIFAISGLVNPERAEIRDKALQMGGQYCPDWTADCTLLICAFANTPKFNQVKKDNGTIISKDWIHECFEQKKLVDIEKYLMHAGEPWRQIDASIMDKPDDECPSPSHLDCDEPTTTLASLQEVEKWVREDVTSSITWLKQQEVQPEADELQSVAIQGIQLCLDDTIECLKKKQSIKKIMESWDYVPRAVQALAAREDKAGKARKKNLWSDMLSEAERLKWIYSKELEDMTSTEDQHVKQASMDGENDDTEDADTDVIRDDDDASSEDTQILDEDEIKEAKETISKLISSLM